MFLQDKLIGFSDFVLVLENQSLKEAVWGNIENLIIVSVI